MPPADHLLFNRQHIIGYSYLMRQPKWALEVIDLENEVVHIENRTDTFREDFRIPDRFRVSLKDYKGSGYDRGHLVASANRRETELLNSETFLLTNMSPQHKDLNRKHWRILEEKVRELLGQDKIVEVYVVSGPLFSIGQKIKVIGLDPKSKDKAGDVVIPVPHHYFKSILAEDVKGNIKIWSFALPNGKCPKELSKYQIETSYVERWSGLILWDRLTGSSIQRKKDKTSKLWFS